MDDRFDPEFYRSPWQRVLPVGPYGIQPYVRIGRSSGSLAAAAALHRLLGIVAGWAASAIVSWRRAAIALSESTARRSRCCP